MPSIDQITSFSSSLWMMTLGKIVKDTCYLSQTERLRFTQKLADNMQIWIRIFKSTRMPQFCRIYPTGFALCLHFLSVYTLKETFQII